MVGLSIEDIKVFRSLDMYQSILVLLIFVEESNQNLTTAEKELLLLHFTPCQPQFSWIQSLTVQPRDKPCLIIPTKHKGVLTSSQKIL